MDKLFSSKLYTYHRFKLIMLLDLIIVALGILSSIFLGRSAYPGDMIIFYGIEIC